MKHALSVRNALMSWTATLLLVVVRWVLFFPLYPEIIDLSGKLESQNPQMLLEEKLPSCLTLVDAVPQLCSIIYFREVKLSDEAACYCLEENLR